MAATDKAVGDSSDIQSFFDRLKIGTDEQRREVLRRGDPNPTKGNNSKVLLVYSTKTRSE